MNSRILGWVDQFPRLVPMTLSCVVVGLFLIAMASPSHAQTGSIRGMVKDVSKVGVPYANVVLRGTQFGGRCELHGAYYILRIPVGTYVLATRMMGYGSTEQTVVVRENDVTIADFTIKEASVRIRDFPTRAPSRPQFTPPPCPAPQVDTRSWRRIEWSGLSFRLPPDYREIKSREIDPEVRRFQAKDGSGLLVDWGMYSVPLPERKDHADYRSCSERIGGAAVQIVTAIARGPRYEVAAAWRDVVPDLNLTICAEARDRGRLNAILAMIRTVRFDNQRRQLGL